MIMAQTGEDRNSRATPVDAGKGLTALLQKLALEDFGIFDTPSLLEEDCGCDSCSDKRSLTSNSLEEIKMIQSCWMELRQYIRIVYRLSMKGSLKSIDSDYQDYMKNIVARLFDVCDPHQLYQRLEAQVKEFIIEVKILLLQILDRMKENPRLPHIFISGLLDRYNKVINAAQVISPVLIQLEKEHIQQFSLTWKIINQRLFQSVIYSDVFFQNSIPLFISQLGKDKGTESNKTLVKEFLKFDNEMGLIESQWVEIESSIMYHLQNKPLTTDKKSLLINDWEEFKTAKKLESIPVPNNPLSAAYSPVHHFHYDKPFIPNISIENINSDIIADSCECHVCLDASAHTPVELIEQVIPLNAHAHAGGFHLYPHIHGTRGEFGPFLPECEIPEICGQITEQQIWQGSFAKGANKFKKMEHGVPLAKHHHHHHHHHHPSNIKKRVDKATQKDQEVISNLRDRIKVEKHKTGQGVSHLKDNVTDSGAHHIHCSKHSDIKRVPFSDHDDEAHPLHDDSHSDNSQADPRHCDCCYCEVFGHGAPSSAPMSRNYQEMRERLRLLLNKKKSKCKSNSIPAQQKNHLKQQPSAGTPPPNSERDTRALEDLLDFIEGTEVKCRNEKKAAKKARQKEKKRVMLNRKKREEEEKARLLEESLARKKREEALAAREMEEKARANKNKKRGGKSNANVNLKLNEKSNPPKVKPGPQMVTIKRVMEPHNSEPTVTITLRGATPNQDRVLYTLLNGQVCKMKDLPNEKKSTSTTKQPTVVKNNSVNNVGNKVKEIINEKTKTKKEAIKNEVNSPQLQMKPAKELTNPTSIQINNAINSLSKKPSPTFNIADIKLPPGITITKVDPSTVQSRTSKIQENNAKKINNNQVRTPSEVIFVSTGTGKRKDNQVLKEPTNENQNGKKKKNKKKSNFNNSILQNNGKGSSYPGLEIQPIKIIESDKDQDLVNHMPVLTISPYADNSSDKNEKKKKRKQKKTSGNNIINPEEWKLLDSVFAPKDIDLDDGDIDDAERELEAFKRFCLQSIPPERKEKVHLNIKDIVLKKKAASFNY